MRTSFCVCTGCPGTLWTIRCAGVSRVPLNEDLYGFFMTRHTIQTRFLPARGSREAPRRRHFPPLELQGDHRSLRSHNQSAVTLLQSRWTPSHPCPRLVFCSRRGL